jgi:serine/threonine protein kinase
MGIDLSLIPTTLAQPAGQRPPAAASLPGEASGHRRLSCQAKDPTQDRAGKLVLGPYVLLQPLGQGGMGQVYLARHRHLPRTVALKVIHHTFLGSPQAIERFRREVGALSRLSHPNIVLVYDAGQAGDTLYFAMEYAPGADLARLLQERGPLPIAECCNYIRQAAMGLQHAFEKGLVDRDIKPSNLFLVFETGVVKILDLGLARLHGPADSENSACPLTEPGSLLGTPDYMAPEQTEDPHMADTRADIYSLGCTLYHLLTGRVPFPGGSLVDKLIRHQTAPPEPIAQLRPETPSGLTAVIARMTAKAPKDRYQTPAAVAEALLPWCRVDGAPDSARPRQSGWKTVWTFLSRLLPS